MHYINLLGKNHATGMQTAPTGVLVKSGVECNSGDVSLGKAESAHMCALKVQGNGGKYFTYGTGGKEGWRYQENTSSESCPEG